MATARRSSLSNNDLSVTKDLIKRLAPSAFVRKSAPKILQHLNGPVLDVAGGSGRHAFYLALHGARVICLDRESSPYERMREALASGSDLHERVTFKQLDLVSDAWPYAPESIGAIINTHFLLLDIIPHFASSVKSGGYVLIETIGGHGENYRQLPKAGELRKAFDTGFTFAHYSERAVGPPGTDAVAVQMLALKK